MKIKDLKGFPKEKINVPYLQERSDKFYYYNKARYEIDNLELELDAEKVKKAMIKVYPDRVCNVKMMIYKD